MEKVDVVCGLKTGKIFFSFSVESKMHRNQRQLLNLEPQLENFRSVYILLSLATKTDTYIGQTSKQLCLRVNEHNSGYRAKDTADPELWPWFSIAFVTGFADDNSHE
jgi:hypothetical protein